MVSRKNCDVRVFLRNFHSVRVRVKTLTLFWQKFRESITVLLKK